MIAEVMWKDRGFLGSACKSGVQRILRHSIAPSIFNTKRFQLHLHWFSAGSDTNSRRWDVSMTISNLNALLGLRHRRTLLYRSRDDVRFDCESLFCS